MIIKKQQKVHNIFISMKSEKNLDPIGEKTTPCQTSFYIAVILYYIVSYFHRKEGDPSIKWNEKSEVNRKSHQGDYEIVDNVARYSHLAFKLLKTPPSVRFDL